MQKNYYVSSHTTKYQLDEWSVKRFPIQTVFIDVTSGHLLSRVVASTLILSSLKLLVVPSHKADLLAFPPPPISHTL